MKKNIINSFVISPNEINHLIIENKKDNFSVLEASFFNSGFSDISNFNECIKNISEISNKNKLANVVIITEKLLKYIFILPKIEGANLKTTILNNFKNRFNISLPQFYIDYEIYNFNNKNIAFVAGIDRKESDPILEILLKNGFRLLALETDINSLKRLLYFHKINDMIINVHLSKRSTIFLIINGNTLFTFRELQFGINDIIDTLLSQDSMNKDEVIIEMKKNGFSSEKINLKSAFDKLTIELQRTIDFYMNQYKYKPVKKIILTGDFFKINEVNNFLSNLFLMDCEIVEPLKKGSVVKSMHELENFEFLNIAIGLGLRLA